MCPMVLPCHCHCQLRIYTAHNCKASDALCVLCTLVKREQKSFSGPGESCQRNVIDLIVWLVTSSRLPTHILAVYVIHALLCVSVMQWIVCVCSNWRIHVPITWNMSSKSRHLTTFRMCNLHAHVRRRWATTTLNNLLILVSYRGYLNHATWPIWT